MVVGVIKWYQGKAEHHLFRRQVFVQLREIEKIVFQVIPGVEICIKAYIAPIGGKSYFVIDASELEKLCIQPDQS